MIFSLLRKLKLIINEKIISQKIELEKQKGSFVYAKIGYPYYVNPKSCKLKIGTGSRIRGVVTFEKSGSSIEIGKNTSIGGQTIFSCSNNIIIGDNVLISFDCKIFDHNSHPMNHFERRNDLKNILSGKGKEWNNVKQATTKIGNDAWIGAGVIILPGITIGERAIIGAGSVVTKDIPDNAIAVGAPAKVKRINENK